MFVLGCTDDLDSDGICNTVDSCYDDPENDGDSDALCDGFCADGEDGEWVLILENKFYDGDQHYELSLIHI